MNKFELVLSFSDFKESSDEYSNLFELKNCEKFSQRILGMFPVVSVEDDTGSKIVLIDKINGDTTRQLSIYGSEETSYVKFLDSESEFTYEELTFLAKVMRLASSKKYD